MKLADQIDKMFDAAAEPVEFPDDKRVAFAEGFLRLGQPGPLRAAAADLVFEELLATGFDEGLGLQFEVLIVSGDAGVADEHEKLSCLSQNPLFRSSLRIAFENCL